MQNNFKFALNDYPIFDESYREILNKKIIEHYMFFEIGYETTAKFNFALSRRMNEIMWKYNEMYKIRMTDFNALYNVDMTETYTHEIQNLSNQNTSSSNNSTINSTNDINASTKDSSTNENSENNESLNTNSIFPDDTDMYTNNHIQNAVKQNINNISTIKNTNDTQSTNNSITNSSSTDSTIVNASTDSNIVEKYEKKMQGSSAGLPFSKALEQFKDFVNTYDIDNQIINELKDLFINIY